MSDVKCDSCSDNSKDIDGFCECTEGYVPSISKVAAKTAKSSFGCIVPFETNCSESYNWNSQIILSETDAAECVSIYDGECYH